MGMIQEIWRKIWRYKYTVGVSHIPHPRAKAIHMPMGKLVGEHPFCHWCHKYTKMRKKLHS